MEANLLSSCFLILVLYLISEQKTQASSSQAKGKPQWSRSLPAEPLALLSRSPSTTTGSPMERRKPSPHLLFLLHFTLSKSQGKSSEPLFPLACCGSVASCPQRHREMSGTQDGQQSSLPQKRMPAGCPITYHPSNG